MRKLKAFLMSLFRGMTEMHPPSKDEGPRHMGNNINIVQNTRKFNRISRRCFQFHIWFIMTLYCKMRQILLRNMTTIFLQNPTKVYYEMRPVVY